MSPNKKPALPLAVYTRVSSQGDRADEELLSHSMQREKVEAGAAALGYELLPERFEDTDASGGTMDRPQFNRVMDGIRRGEFGGVAVAKLSRFGRTVIGALSAIKEIEERGGAFVSLDPPIDTSTATGRFILTVFLGLYAMEREATAEIAYAVKERKIAAGIHQATHAPAGYDFEVLGYAEKNGKRKEIRGRLVPNEHAPAVREAFELRAGGGTWAEVAALLTERGVPARSVRWSYTGARSIIENEVYTGVALSGERRKEGAHERIVSRTLWQAANARAGTRAVTWNGHDGPLLGGIIRCASCGGAMSRDWTGRADGKRYMSYKCKSNPSCGRGKRASISARRVEPLVVDAALGMVGSVDYEGREPSEEPEADEWEAMLDALEREQAELDAELESGAVSASAYGKAATVLEKRRAELEAARPRAALGETYLMFVSETGVRDAFDAASLPRQRAVLRQLVRRVEVRPGRGPAEKRVTVELAQFRPEEHGLVAR